VPQVCKGVVKGWFWRVRKGWQKVLEGFKGLEEVFGRFFQGLREFWKVCKGMEEGFGKGFESF